VPSGGAAVGGAPAAGGAAPAAADEAKEEKKEEEKVCVFMSSTLPLCLTFTSLLFRKSRMTIWASVCSIRIKLCQCNIFIPPTSCSMIFVGQRLNELWEEWPLQVVSAENLYCIWGICPIPFPICTWLLRKRVARCVDSITTH
jgi:hypothetical protein